MKILPVSFSLNSKGANINLEHQFLYTAKELRPNQKFAENFSMFAGSIALFAVIMTLINLGVNKKPPKHVFVV